MKTKTLLTTTACGLALAIAIVLSTAWGSAQSVNSEAKGDRLLPAAIQIFSQQMCV